METLIANVKGKARYAVRNGRKYLVAPTSLIVPGVLFGSKGPIYYPPSETKQSTQKWNRVPLTLRHPRDVDGNFILASTPGVIDKIGLGFLDLPRYVKNKLRGDSWFDIELTAKADKSLPPSLKILPRLKAGDQIEISVGLNAALDLAPFGARDAKGRLYYATASEFKPDHIAILPDEVGACSLKDGCGVFANSGFSSLPSANSRWTPLTAKLVDCSCYPVPGRRGVWEVLQTYAPICNCAVPEAVEIQNPKGQWKPPSAGNAPAGVKKILKAVYSKWRDEHPGENPATKARGAKIAWGAVRKAGWRKNAEGKWVKKGSKMAANSGHGRLRMELLTNYDKSLQDKMNDLATQLRDRFGYDAYMSDVYEDYVVYSRNGKWWKLEYDEEDGYCELSDEKPQQVRRYTQYEPIENAGGQTMALNQQQRNTIIDELVANCDCWKGQGDRDLLASFPDEKLLALKEQSVKNKQAEAIANAAVSGFKHKDNAYRFNPESGKWENSTGIENSPTGKSGKSKKKDSTYAGDDGEDDEEEDAKTQRRMERRRKKMMNADGGEDRRHRRPVTFDELLRSAPTEIQNRFNQLTQLEEIEKKKVIEQLLSNVEPADRRAHSERLQTESLTNLQYMLSLLPKGPSREELAAQQAEVQNRRARRQQVEEDMLVAPKMTWNSIDDEEPTGNSNNGQNGGGGSSDRIAPASIPSGSGFMGSEDEDEWLRSAPAHLRNELMSARSMMEQERRRLVDELTANITDENEEKRLRSRLSGMSVDQLRDLLVLQPGRKTSSTTFFGASAPSPLNNAGGGSGRGSSAVSDDDILPLPSTNYNDSTGRKAR